MNFQAILIHPNKKSTKRLRDVLNQLYSHLDGSASAPAGNADVSIPTLRVLFASRRIFRQLSKLIYLYLNNKTDMTANLIQFILQNVDIPGLGFGQSEYYPYVHYKLNIDMVESKV